mgnify:CR=1 FL=1
MFFMEIAAGPSRMIKSVGRMKMIITIPSVASKNIIINGPRVIPIPKIPHARQRGDHFNQ